MACFPGWVDCPLAEWTKQGKRSGETFPAQKDKMSGDPKTEESKDGRRVEKRQLKQKIEQEADEERHQEKCRSYFAGYLRQSKEETTRLKEKSCKGSRNEQRGKRMKSTVPGHPRLCRTQRQPYTYQAAKGVAYLMRNVIRRQFAQHIFR